jgi:hypothetical protein
MSNKSKEFGFEMKIQTTMEHKEGSKTSSMKQVKYMLHPSHNLDRDMYLIDNGEKGYTKVGADAITATLVVALVSNIHYAHEAGYTDSEQHLKKIISMLEDGLVAQTKTVFGDEFNKNIHE